MGIGGDSLSCSHLLQKSMGNPIGGLMGIGGDSPPLPFTLKINGSPHGVADLQVSYFIHKNI